MQSEVSIWRLAGKQSYFSSESYQRDINAVGTGKHALSSLIDRDNKALLVRDEQEQVHIITQADLLAAMTISERCSNVTAPPSKQA